MEDIFFRHHLAQTTGTPIGLDIERAEGSYLYTTDGRAYLDMVSGIGVSALGHGHPAVRNAIIEQVNRHLHVMVYGEFTQRSQIDLARLLTSQLPPALDTCYFVNSGTEANEAALKLSKRITGRSRILAFHGSYHGSTHGSLSVSGNELRKSSFRPLLPDVYFLRLNEASDLEMIDERVACVILETVQGDAGVRLPRVDYMNELWQRCQDTGVLLILDEIQCGMGRTGTLFAFEQFGIAPDILTLGKALGGGMPIGAFVSSRENMEKLISAPPLGHITTFGGHPVNCAAAHAALKALLDEGHIGLVEQKGAKLEEILVGHPAVREIRRCGLLMAIDLGDAAIVQQVVQRCLASGLISFWFLSCPDSFRLAPPLNISEQELSQAASIILKAFDDALE